ncbi:MAG: SGNH/GDSL hydrolase family protein [Solobacterium sp.]|nr:SGNH/GDSL hydrolase family protein [Solobacterium sp.]
MEYQKTTGSITNQKKYGNFGRVVLFAAIAAVLIMVSSFFFHGYTEHGYQYKDVRVKQDELIYLDDPKEVLFFGDSIAWAAYRPKIFWETNGIPSYNCATSGQWLGDGRVILSNVIEKQTPIIAVWDANSIYTNISRAKYYLAKYVSVFHYHFAYLSKSYPREKDALRGFNSSDAVNPYTGTPDYMYDMPLQPFTSLAEEKLEEIYQICKDHHITLVMTCSPNPYAWNMGRHKAVQEWCDSHGVEFVDYNLMLDEIGIDWNTDTRDGGEHLNNSGSYKVCIHLSKYLKEKFNMNDFRNNPYFRDWNKEYGGGKS